MGGPSTLPSDKGERDEIGMVHAPPQSTDKNRIHPPEIPRDQPPIPPEPPETPSGEPPAAMKPGRSNAAPGGPHAETKADRPSDRPDEIGPHEPKSDLAGGMGGMGGPSTLPSDKGERDEIGMVHAPPQSTDKTRIHPSEIPRDQPPVPPEPPENPSGEPPAAMEPGRSNASSGGTAAQTKADRPSEPPPENAPHGPESDSKGDMGGTGGPSTQPSNDGEWGEEVVI